MPDSIRNTNTIAAIIAARCFLNRAQINWRCEAVKYASFEDWSSGVVWDVMSLIRLSHDAAADARIDCGQQQVGEEV